MARRRAGKQQHDAETRPNSEATAGHEAELWAMADALRGSMDAAEYKHVVLGLIFLKYISDAFEERHAFRAGDVWLARSRRYGDIRKALLSAPAIADADRSLPAPASPHDWLAERRFR